ncbi:unnamed protein product [Adineta ricciae]|uniref:Uncharacterized protein n=1 Tax=Adineta ricciae TaxID=249248 RepID=A0A815QUA1_ADIRI|nr:unnamed protein product [Adineta ricciae]CAF1681658.1 unnamed protein product [Adineta ricciae]
MYDECLIYKIFVPNEIVQYYFPNYLIAYKENNLLNYQRRIYFFSSSNSTRIPFDDYIDQNSNWISLKSFLQILLREPNSQIRYSFVLLDNYLIFIRVPYLLPKSFHPLCKHITISSRSQYVRFAGEIWCDEFKQIYVNNNSGTYRPSDVLIQSIIEFFSYLLPKKQFYGISYRINALPPMRERIL